MKRVTNLLIACLCTGLALSAQAQDKNVHQQTIDTLDKLSGGPHAGFRANHAKGVLASGIFTPTPAAASISTAPHFKRAVPVTVRFSTGTGVPTIPDANPNSRPYGMAIRFSLGGGSFTDFVGISYNGFPVASPEDFLGLLSAVAAIGKSDETPSPIEKFLGTHPAALKFVQTPKPVPQSFTTQAFFGVNAFEFINAKGQSQFGRYQIVPVQGERHFSDDDAARLAPNYLMEELPARLAKGPAKFKVMLQLAEAEDVTTDPSITWPAERKLVELGTLSLTRGVPPAQSEQPEKKLAFNPLILPEGIKPSNDPVLLARPIAYALSVVRRN